MKEIKTTTEDNMKNFGWAVRYNEDSDMWEVIKYGYHYNHTEFDTKEDAEEYVFEISHVKLESSEVK